MLQLKLIFEVSCDQTKWGEIVLLVGGTRELGQWDLSRGVILSTSKGQFPRWRSNIITFNDDTIEFKFAVSKQDGKDAKWEKIANRQIKASDVSRSDSHTVVSCRFDEDQMKFSNDFLFSPIPSMYSVSQPSLCDISEDFSQEWMGREVRFVKSHTGLKALEDHRIFDSSTSYSSIQPLLHGNTEAHSYLRKLQLVDNQVKRIGSIIEASQKDSSPTGSQSPTGLTKSTEEAIQLTAAISIYLTFVRSGAIPCCEDGGHYRPSHHASAACSIFSNLLKIVPAVSHSSSFKSGHRETIILLIRRILPLLPSFAEGFTCAVPLTRIRDIAHRNDIPHDLKIEIKHTLQNKLHRCAGPEDLVAAYQMLQRLLENRSNYSEGFVQEFIKFHEELKEFFNARSLTDRLMSVRGSNLNDNLNHSINKFLIEKPKVHASGASVELLLSVLRLTVEIRESLFELRKSENLSSVICQEVWLADIATEQFAFTLVSQIATRTCADENLQWGQLSLGDPRWMFGLATLKLCLRHVQYSGFHEEECLAVENMYELITEHCWKDADGFKTVGFTSIQCSLNESKLLIKTVLDRTLRLTESYTETVLELFPPIVREIGRAAGVASHSVEVFAEADIRANIVFQLSRVAASLLNQVSAALGETGVEVIVDPPNSDRVVGRLIDISDLWKLPTAVSQLGQPSPHVIVRLAQASGDEEVAGLSSEFSVVAIILMHSIPHLSHLSIRARQERLPLVAVVNPDASVAIQSSNLVGQDCQLLFTFDGVELTKKEFPNYSNEPKRPSDNQDESPIVFRHTDQNAISQTEIAASAAFSPVVADHGGLSVMTPSDSIEKFKDRVGAKAATCGYLMKIAREGGADFGSPACWVLPFGSMEYVLQQQGLYDAYSQLLKDIDQLSPSMTAETDIYFENLKALLEKVKPTQEVLQPLIEELEKYANRNGQTKSVDSISFIARSSANVEDLAGMSAAGLYESVANINPMKNFDEFSRSVAAVWASLHSRRAILSRRVANVSQELARMAVLIQDLAVPYLSFVVHTHCPLSQTSLSKLMKQHLINSGNTQSDWIYVELALGLGEILASGSVHGSPFSLLIHKTTGDFICLNFGSFAVQYNATSTSGQKSTNDDHRSSIATQFVECRVTDYTTDIFTLNRSMRDTVASKIRRASLELEKSLGGPQDIEGSIVLNSDIQKSLDSASLNQVLLDRVRIISSLTVTPNDISAVIVQSRPQPV